MHYLSMHYGSVRHSDLAQRIDDTTLTCRNIRNKMDGLERIIKMESCSENNRGVMAKLQTKSILYQYRILHSLVSHKPFTIAPFDIE